jgi:hypothetical protein
MYTRETALLLETLRSFLPSFPQNPSDLVLSSHLAAAAFQNRYSNFSKPLEQLLKSNNR